MVNFPPGFVKVNKVLRAKKKGPEPLILPPIIAAAFRYCGERLDAICDAAAAVQSRPAFRFALELSEAVVLQGHDRAA